MPSAFDRRKISSAPDADRSPLRNLLDFESINDTAQQEGGRIGGLFDAFAKLFGLSGILDLLDGTEDGTFDPGAVIANFFNTLILPLSVFSEAIMAPIRDLVDGIVALVGPIPIVGPVLANLANFLGLTHTTAGSAVGIGENAQYSADTANAGVALLNAQLAGTGTVFTDTFNRAAATNLGTDYDRFMMSGSGTWGPDGSGNVVWTPGGAATQGCADRVKKAMTTKYQSIATVLTAPPRGGQAGANSYTQLCLRVNATRTTYVMATINAGFVEIGYVNSGTYTRLGAPVTVSMGNGDLWEFRAGTAADQYQLTLLQNNLTVCDRIDSGHSSQAGSSPTTWVGIYDYGMVLANAGVVQFGFFTLQIEAPTLQILTVADRTP